MGLLTRGFYMKRQGILVKNLSLGKVILRCFVSAIILLVLLLLSLIIFKNKLIFFPVEEMPLSLEDVGWEFYDVFVDGYNGKINLWYLPAPDKEAYTVILFHGNGGNLNDMIGRIILYHKLKFGVLALDYNGFGKSEGSPSEEATYQNGEAAWNYLIEQNIAPEKILLHGFSLGGGVASKVALDHKEYHNPLILDSTFTSIKDVMGYRGEFLGQIASLVVGNAFDTHSRLKEISPSHLMIFHSPEDQVVPYTLGQKNYEDYSGGPKSFVELSGEHLDFILNQMIYDKHIYAVFGKPLSSQSDSLVPQE
ncbi:MAG: alpha/beta hydrolase [Deltaproteobacteria bacterium]|jgi:pimeloyl-ACP methyl ester carboxylesterase|nr:alpha/beta hydrolase [Deltaproteobacteria bacterium]